MDYIKWDFPNSGGTVKGIADAGIETFKGSLLPSLARETCQNSLDAAIGDERSVVAPRAMLAIPGIIRVFQYATSQTLFDLLQIRHPISPPF